MLFIEEWDEGASWQPWASQSDPLGRVFATCWLVIATFKLICAYQSLSICAFIRLYLCHDLVGAGCMELDVVWEGVPVGQALQGAPFTAGSATSWRLYPLAAHDPRRGQAAFMLQVRAREPCSAPQPPDFEPPERCRGCLLQLS